MPTVAVRCPECEGPLRLPTWSPGRLLRCPRCAAEFRLGSEPGHVAPARHEPQANTAMLVGVIGGVAAFVAVVVVVVVSLIRSEGTPRTDPVVAQQQPDPTPKQTPTPPRRVENPPQTIAPRPRVTGPARKLPADLQAKVSKAIEQGLAYLRLHQLPDGRFGTVHEGTTYLVGLTLLECGVPASDPAVKRVTNRLRSYMTGPYAVRTYDISLALLYLDRLDDPADRNLIQSLALRLIASQEPDGGWGYQCNRLNKDSERAMFAALKQTRPEVMSDLMVRLDHGRIVEPSGVQHASFVAQEEPPSKLESMQSKLKAAQRELRSYPDLMNIPSMAAVKEAAAKPGQPSLVLPAATTRGSDADNSNTQFAALGLWIACRYDIPCERALALVAARFRTTQARNGGWAYKPRDPEDTPSMTCAGLLGLAVGHGLRIHDEQKRHDPQIADGLKYLAKHLQSDPKQLNLYFIWSLERVGVLFNLERVGTTDWYDWGARRLVAAQDFDGAWSRGGYHDASAVHDTCFALLFLKQANLVGDLSMKLDRMLDVGAFQREVPK